MSAFSQLSYYLLISACEILYQESNFSNRWNINGTTGVPISCSVIDELEMIK